MSRGLLAFGLVFAIIASPIAAAVCEVRCALHDTDAAMADAGAEHHSCHGESSSAGPAVNGITHLCGHADEIQAGADPSVPHSVAPALVATTVTFFPPSARASHIRVTNVEKSPPGSLTPTSQLRV